MDLIEGAPELTAYGALGAQYERISGIDAELTQVARASARTAGVGQGVATLLSGLAMWGALVAGVAAVHAGTLDGVLLAVIALVRWRPSSWSPTFRLRPRRCRGFAGPPRGRST